MKVVAFNKKKHERFAGEFGGVLRLNANTGIPIEQCTFDIPDDMLTEDQLKWLVDVGRVRKDTQEYKVKTTFPRAFSWNWMRPIGKDGQPLNGDEAFDKKKWWNGKGPVLTVGGESVADPHQRVNDQPAQ